MKDFGFGGMHHLNVGGHLDHGLIEGLSHNLENITSHSTTTDLPQSDYEPRFKMGSIAAFLFVFGQFGMLFMNALDDSIIIIAVVFGFFVAALYDRIIGFLAKESYTPVKMIEDGDTGIVMFKVTPEKAGLVKVIKRDGRETNIMAVGKFQHDTFEKDEEGYIVGKRGKVYLITRGVEKPAKPIPKQKALDLNN